MDTITYVKVSGGHFELDDTIKCYTYIKWKFVAFTICFTNLKLILERSKKYEVETKSKEVHNAMAKTKRTNNDLQSTTQNTKD